MTKQKKLFLAVTLSVMLFSSMFILTGCGSSNDSEVADDSSNTTTQTSNSSNTTIQLQVNVVNQYPNATLTALYLSGAGQEAWGNDLLNGQQMPTGTQLPLVLNIDKDNVKWDIKAVDENGTAVEFRNLDLSNVSTSGATITLSASEDGTPVAVAQ